MGNNGFIPLPSGIKTFLSRFPLSKQISVYARLVKGVDLSFIAPDELGCAESVTRMLSFIAPQLGVPVITGTWTLDQHLKKNPKFLTIPRSMVKDGCIIIAVTGEGSGAGHVGIVVGSVVYSNNSYTGKWDAHISHEAFRWSYGKRGFPIKYYLPISNK